MGDLRKPSEGKRTRILADMFTDPECARLQKDRRGGVESDPESDEMVDRDSETYKDNQDNDRGAAVQISCSHGSCYDADCAMRGLSGLSLQQPQSQIDSSVPECFVQSQVSVEINSLELQLCSILTPTRAENPQQARATVTHRVVLTQPAGSAYTHCYDLDIAVPAVCHRLQLRGETLFRLGTQPDQPVLVFRKSFLMRNIPTRQGLFGAYPDAVRVGGTRYRLHHCADQHNFCFAFPSDERFSLRCERRIVVGVTSTGLPDAKQVAQGAVLVKENYDTASGFDAVELPATFDFYRVGAQLWPPPYGEVYKGYRVRAVEPSSHGGAQFSFTQCEEVAVKVVRHPNDYLPGADQIWHMPDGRVFPPSALIHHEVPAGAQFTSKHAAPYFEAERARGRNENLMTEIETMEFIMHAVSTAISAAPPPATTGAAGQGHLKGRFLGHKEVAISCDNLYIVTDYASFGTLNGYAARSELLNKKLSEAAVKHVVRHLLQGLAFLHERGLAHQDMSLENAVLRALTEVSLQARHREFLSDADFARLDVALIDMGHMASHERYVDASLRHSAMNASNVTVDTATTCESNSGCMDTSETEVATGATLLDVTPMTHSRAGSVDCASEVRVSESSSSSCSPLQRRFKMRRVPQHPLGKILYRSPQMSSALNPASGDSAGQAREYCGMCLDMWQVGVMTIIMLTGSPPFEVDRDPGTQQDNEKAWFCSVEHGRLGTHFLAQLRAANEVVRMPLGSLVTAEALEFLTWLLRYKAEDRPTAEEALKHPWLVTS